MASFFADSDSDSGSPSRAGPSRTTRPAAAAAPLQPAPRFGSLSAAGPRYGSPGIDDDDDDDMGEGRAAGRGAHQGTGGRLDFDMDDGGGDLPGGQDDAQGEDDAESDVAKLMRAWVSERSAPGIMRWEEDLVDGVVWRIEQQVRFCSLLPRRRVNRPCWMSWPDRPYALVLYQTARHGEPASQGGQHERGGAL